MLGDKWEVTLSYQIGSVPTLNVLHFRESTVIAPAGADPAAKLVADSIHVDGIADSILGMMSEDVELISIYARKLVVASIPYLKVIGSAAPNNGALAGAPVPPQAALLIGTYSDADAPIIARGRTYVPGTDAGTQTEGVLSAAAQTAAQTLVDAMIGEIAISVGGTGGLTWAIKTVVGGVALHDITSAQVRSNLATIKSRRARPGVA